MANLSHWDFAENFSGYDAAALMLGLEPRESHDEQWRIGVVTDRMELHYKYAINRIFHEAFSEPSKELAHQALLRIELSSVKLDDLHHRCWLYGEETPLSDWFADKRLTKFENQEFQRHTVAHWLAAVGMKSIYQFDHKQPVATPVPLGRWPWGNHHTEPLGHLEAAARRYWGENYDPSDASTAPINATVSEWLQTERKVSKTMADSIASLLRADGLPTGPRK
jgi:hypothetical protein